MLAIVDSGPLLAAANSADRDHSACVDILTRGEFDLLIPTLCVAEVSYFLGSRHGATVEASFVEGLADFHVVSPEPEDWVRIGELVRQYDDLPLDTVDASVVVLADRMRTRQILTLDRRHFSVVKNDKGRPFELHP